MMMQNIYFLKVYEKYAMAGQPIVSVLMTAFNREQFIKEAIESVLASSLTDFELIITDDCSTDRTYEVAKAYELSDARVRVFSNEKNLKDYPNRNMAATYARGKYIKYLDSDDKIFKEGLLYCVQAMEQFPEAAIGMQFSQKEFGVENPVSWSPGKIIDHHFFVRGCLNIGPSGCIIKREIFCEVGGFDPGFGVASDNFFNITLAAKYPVVLLPQSFFFYRIHEGQEKKDKEGYLKNNYQYLKRLVTTVDLPISSMKKSKLALHIEKSFARQLLRYIWETKNFQTVKKIMKDTNFSILDFYKAVS